jgi:hypothetical protein
MSARPSPLPVVTLVEVQESSWIMKCRQEHVQPLKQQPAQRSIRLHTPHAAEPMRPAQQHTIRVASGCQDVCCVCAVCVPWLQVE